MMRLGYLALAAVPVVAGCANAPGGGAARTDGIAEATEAYVACGVAATADARAANARQSDEALIDAAVAACRAEGYEVGRHLMLDEAHDVRANFRQAPHNITGYAMPIVEADLRRYLQAFLKEVGRA